MLFKADITKKLKNKAVLNFVCRATQLSLHESTAHLIVVFYATSKFVSKCCQLVTLVIKVVLPFA